MNKLLFIAAFIIGSYSSAQASCPNQVTGSISLMAGGAPTHITIVNASSCAALLPGTVTVSAPSGVGFAADATGFNMSGITPGSNQTVTFTPNGFAPTQIIFNVIAPASAATSP